ncbi:MAG: hypothetical protein JXX29_14170 [Deltaproteobacteria bacterium]|nr:hypothetical protein [Deltaproteobacteria bacterium]MBN2672824.1 hypothetical protein [Deltaproteobacteria bacterium]
MFDVKVSAPGKLFLSGEYAVLEGAPAVIDSVNRRVFAAATRDNIPQSALIKEIKSAVTAFLTERSGSPVGQLPNVDIDSTGFSISRRKLGIGSSAAVSAATTGVLFEWAGLSIEDHRDDIFLVADTAHRAYQNGKGSGADVATSIFGGTVIFQVENPIINVSPLPIHKVFVWTGKSASTVSLVQEVKKLQEQSPTSYASIMEELVRLAGSLATAYREENAADVISLTHAYGNQLDVLGNAAHIPIITATMHRIADIAKEMNGAFKPSGAGGGDAAMAIFSNASDAHQFSLRISQNGLEVLDFQTGVSGLCKET